MKQQSMGPAKRQQLVFGRVFKEMLLIHGNVGYHNLKPKYMWCQELHLTLEIAKEIISMLQEDTVNHSEVSHLSGIYSATEYNLQKFIHR